MADPTDVESVKRLLAEHRDQVVRTYRAVGTGVGSDEPGGRGYAIVVYVKEKSDVPAEPAALEGVRLRFVVTGEFKLQH